LSPSRLAYRVLERTTNLNDNMLDTSGQFMLITNLLYKYEKKLKYYKADIFKPGFIKSLSEMIDNIIQAQIDIDNLQNILEKSEDNILKLKWHDILLIYNDYIMLTNSKFSSKENKMRFVAQNINKSAYLNGKFVYIYGFDVITENIATLMLGIAKSAKVLELWLIMDSEDSHDSSLFEPVRQSVYRLIDILSLNDINYELKYFNENTLEIDNAIAHIDSVLYSNVKKGTNLKYTKKQDSIKIMNCSSPIEEAELVAKQIKELIKKGINYGEITIMLPSNSDYTFAIETALMSLNIPYFSNEELLGLQHSLISYIINSVFTVSKDYDDEYMTYIMSNPYCGLKIEEISFLKNYAKKYGISRSKWLKEFCRGEKHEIETAEKLRLKLLRPLIKLKENLAKAKNSNETISALYELIENINAFEKIDLHENLLLKHKMNLRAEQNQQLWNYIIDVFSQLNLILDGSRATFKKLPELIKQGFSAISINALPSNENMVAVGTLGHMISGETKVLFLVGLDDSVLADKTESIVNEEEMLFIEQRIGKEIGLSKDNANTIAKLDIKKALTLPKNMLFLSYSKTDLSGKPLWPLNIVNEIQNRYYSDVEIIDEKLGFSLNNFDNVLSLFLRQIPTLNQSKNKEEYDNGLAKLAFYYNSIKHNVILEKLFLNYINKLRCFSNLKNIDKNTTFSLYKGEALSVSRLESFAECPFKHFIDYGIKPQIVEDWKVNPLIMGNFYHEILDSFIKEIKTLENFENISENEINEIINKIIDNKNFDENFNPINDGSRNKAAFYKAKKDISFAAYTYVKQLSLSKFKIYETELEFGKSSKFPPIILELDNGRSVTLRGKIDRVDVYKSKNGNYVRVIDYKSKSKKLSPSELWYGSQIQLTIYLDSASKGIEHSIPAGAFYIPIG
ncbi:MAG: hypothetical protein GYA87_06030, partial [Christensenellaceae bacterium]|nr:hypothetical protein [Christensenellaceae bacterium]